MKQLIQSERIRRFSLRKLSVGLVSATIGVFFCAGDYVGANESTSSVQVQYQYVIDSELVSTEREAIIREPLQQVQATQDATYYLVYRSDISTLKEQLPNTGEHEAWLSAIATVSGTALLLVAVKLTKKKGPKILSVLLVIGGMSCVLPVVDAMESVILAHLNQTLSLEKGAFLPEPAIIENYTYIGYIRANASEQGLELDKLAGALSQLTDSVDEATKTPIVEGIIYPKLADDAIKKLESDVSVPPAPTVPIPEDSTPVEPPVSGETQPPESDVPVPPTPTVPIPEDSTLVEPPVSGETQPPESDVPVPPTPTVPIPEDSTPVEPPVSGETQPPESDVPVHAEPTPPKVDPPIEEDSNPKENPPVIHPEEPIIETEEVEVAFETHTQQSDELWEGDREVVTQGQPGRKRITKTYPSQNGQKVGEPTIDETQLTPPTHQVERVGTKPINGSVTEIHTELIDFNTRYEDDATLDEGQTQEVTAGSEGEATITTEYRTVRGVKTSEVLSTKREVTRTPIDKVIKQGTRPLPEEPIIETEEVEVAFETHTQQSDELWEGDREVVTQGQPGRNRITKTYPSQNGQKVGEPTIEETQLTPPTHQVERVGTKPINGSVTEIHTELIDFNTRYEDDATLDEGQTQEVTAGSEGEATITTEYRTVRGVKTSEVLSTKREVTRTPIDKVIKQGTRPIAKEKPTVELANIDIHEQEREARIHYRVQDNDNALTRIVVKLYAGDTLIKEVAIVDVNHLSATLPDLQSYVNYAIETVYDYNLRTETQSETLPERQEFMIAPKLLEFRDISDKELYRVEEDGTLTRVTGFSTLPQDIDKYIVKLKRSHHQDLILPVAKIAPIDAQSAFKVTVAHPRLVTFNNLNTDTVENYSFDIDKIVLQPNAYTSFAELVNAIKQEPNGTHYLASDMIVPQGGADTETYITTDFTGSLSSIDGNKVYAIIGLDKPLFNKVSNARISNLAFKKANLNLPNQKEFGVLAKTASQATINNVAVEGAIRGKQDIAGLVYKAENNTTLNHIKADVTLSVHNSARHLTYNVGGIVGTLFGSTLSHSQANVKIDAPIDAPGTSIGALVAGATSGSQIKNNYASGNITVTSTKGYVGGTIGKIAFSEVSHLISEVAVTNGSQLVGYNYGSNFNEAKVVTGIAKGNLDYYAGQIAKADADVKLQQWGLITSTTESSTEETTSADVAFDYSGVRNAKAGYETSYANVAKLLPFYDRHTIVKYGNLVDTNSKLFTTRLVSAIARKNDGTLINVYRNPQEATQLLLHFADGTSQQLALTWLGNYKDTKVQEYQLGDDLLYTPEQFANESRDFVASLVQPLSSVDYFSDAVANALSITDEKDKKLNSLYLKDSFDTVKSHLATHLEQLLAHQEGLDLSHATTQRYLKQRILANKEKLLLGLAYLNKWYGVQFDDTNVKELMMSNVGFYGKKVDMFSFLESLAETSDTLKAMNNQKTFANKIAKWIPNATTLETYFNKNIRLFSPNKSLSDWFKSATKAFIYEAPSQVVPDATIDVYTRLSRRENYANYILPLLNVSDNSVYVVSTMTTLTFGSYGHHVDETLRANNPEVHRREVERMNTTELPKYAQRWANFLDLWYRLVAEQVKPEFLNRDITVWDGYYIKDGTHKRWVAEFGDSYQAVNEFFGPINRWYRHNNGIGAYANERSFIYFVEEELLSTEGTSTFSHEMVHSLDKEVLLNGYGRRRGQSSESYALGLLESVASPTAYYYGMNAIFDFGNASSIYNKTPNQFKTPADVQRYMKGMFDVTYLLELAEVEEMLKLDSNDRQRLLNKIVMKKDDPVYENNALYYDAVDVVRAITPEEWRTMDLRSIDDFVANNLILKNSINPEKEYVRDLLNNYYFLPLYVAMYGGYLNDQGTVGGLQFRRTAFELLAEKGWEEGFIPYVTNQYLAQAQQERKPLSDTYIFNKIFNGTVTSYTEFKQQAYKERLAKKDQLKSVTINLNGQNIAVDNYDKLKELFQQALEKDVAKFKAGQGNVAFERQQLKLALIRAYSDRTDNFVHSIFEMHP
ncbi:G5 domain-containing protein [Aerococcaceae bacterium NML191292]|nr:G5 domain-containing protein [Aerococcaceae bacterium NML191292]